MPASADALKLQDLLDRLQEFDLLLDTDPKFPSVSGLVAGDRVHGSWWSHPKAREIFRLACDLRREPEVLLLKLISGKITFVNRPLWPAVYAIGVAREPWQVQRLSPAAKALLKKVDKAGTADATGDPVRELEARLLVLSESVHTDEGHHAKQVQTWESWAKEVKLGRVKLSVDEAKTQLEQVVERLNKQFQANGKLPWQRHGRIAHRS
jgi:hypothetical protein